MAGQTVPGRARGERSPWVGRALLLAAAGAVALAVLWWFRPAEGLRVSEHDGPELASLMRSAPVVPLDSAGLPGTLRAVLRRPSADLARYAAAAGRWEPTDAEIGTLADYLEDILHQQGVAGDEGAVLAFAEAHGEEINDGLMAVLWSHMGIGGDAAGRGVTRKEAFFGADSRADPADLDIERIFSAHQGIAAHREQRPLAGLCPDWCSATYMRGGVVAPPPADELRRHLGRVWKNSSNMVRLLKPSRSLEAVAAEAGDGSVGWAHVLLTVRTEWDILPVPLMLWYDPAGGRWHLDRTYGMSFPPWPPAGADPTPDPPGRTDEPFGLNI